VCGVCGVCGGVEIGGYMGDSGRVCSVCSVWVEIGGYIGV
jgi:hypothetical protein